jgi:hypothetical protein
MAEFSKQYCEQHLPDLPGDFDILEVTKDLLCDHFIQYICEGYGFIAIGKDESGEILFAFRKNKDEIEWKPYHEVVVQ